MSKNIFFILGTIGEFIKLVPVMKNLNTKKINFKIILTGQGDIKNHPYFKNIEKNILMQSKIVKKKNFSNLVIFFFQTLFRIYFFLKKKEKNIIIIHGDTISSLIGALSGWFLNLKIYHVESGYRSNNIFSPFPEEIVRMIISKLSFVMFAPNEKYAKNLKKYSGQVVITSENTNIETFDVFKEKINSQNYFITIFRRQESLLSKQRCEKTIQIIKKISENYRGIIILHDHSKEYLKKYNLLNKLYQIKNIEIRSLLNYGEFKKLFISSKFILTDGGGNQQEAYYAGKPCLLLRDRSEILEGLNQNVYISKFSLKRTKYFISNLDKFKKRKQISKVFPSKIIVDFIFSKLNEKPRIVWMSWKDIRNPEAGGAELTTHEYIKNLVQKGYSVKLFTRKFKNSSNIEKIDNYDVVRYGNRFTVYIMAFIIFKFRLESETDLIIDECNTLPFFSNLYSKKKIIFWIQQFAKEVWFYQMSAPFSYFGYFLEEKYLRLYKNIKTITFAKSTKNDLIKLGFKNIQIVKEACKVKKISNINFDLKNKNPTLLFISQIRPMKRFDHILEAFFYAKKEIPNLRLEVIGSGSGIYFEKIKNRIKNYEFKKDIKMHGPIFSDKKKQEIMKKAHYLCAASVREGWGIIISEAGKSGLPSIVYNVNGLKDSTNYGKSGVITKPRIKSMAKAIIGCVQIINTNKYKQLCYKAKKFSDDTNVEKTIDVVTDLINK